MRPCGQGSGCRGQDTNRRSSRQPDGAIKQDGVGEVARDRPAQTAPRVESKEALHQRANHRRGVPTQRLFAEGVAAHLGPQSFDVRIALTLRTYERKEIHRTWHSKVSGRESAATVGGRQIVPARGHAACPALRGSTWRASTGPGEVRHRHLLGKNRYTQAKVPCQAKACLRGRTTAL